MKVKEITLLSAEEYVKYRAIIPLIDGWWWLRSPAAVKGFATGVNSVGDIDGLGFYVSYNRTAVRPTLKLDLEFSDSLFWYNPKKLFGAKIEYGNYRWIVLDANLGELYVLCDSPIAERRFDPESNNWATSELKQWLETDGLKLITA